MRTFSILTGLILLMALIVGCGEEIKVADTGDTVTVHYTGKLEDGTVFDSSEGKEPLIINLGENAVIPGFENGLMGMKEGETKTLNISPEEGYGPKNPEAIRMIPRSILPPEYNLEVGGQLPYQAPNGQPMTAEILELTDDSVKVDMNFPLAGKNLIFDVTVVQISKPGQP